MQYSDVDSQARPDSGSDARDPGTDSIPVTDPVTDPAVDPVVRRVGPDAHLTLHYRLTLADTGADLINTFEGKPATLQLGIGQMAEPLERRLQGLQEGASEVFDLEPMDAFGPRNPDLLQRVSRAMLAANSEIGVRYVPGDLVEFSAPEGGRFAGVLKEVDERGAIFDFNHPLAGQRIRFEVRILGVL